MKINNMKGLLRILIYLVILIVIGVIVGLITQNAFIGFITICAIPGVLGLFLALRQLYWWITKKGDYAKDNKEE